MSQLPPLNYAVPWAVPPKRGIGRRIVLWTVFGALAFFVLMLMWLKQATPSRPSTAVSEFYSEVKAGNVASIRIDGDSIDGQFRKPPASQTMTRFQVDLPPGTTGNWTFTQWLLETSPTTVVRTESTSSLLTNVVLPFIPWLLIMGFVWFTISRLRRHNRSHPMPVVIVQPEAR